MIDNDDFEINYLSFWHFAREDMVVWIALWFKKNTCLPRHAMA